MAIIASFLLALIGLYCLVCLVWWAVYRSRRVL